MVPVLWCRPRQFVVIVALGLGFLALGCGSTPPSEEPSAGPVADSLRAKRLLAQIDQTPDSLATLPGPSFFRSPTPRAGHPWAEHSSRCNVEVVGGLADGQAQWGLLVRSIVSDTLDLHPGSFVDLIAERVVMRRGQAWRTLQAKNDSLLDTRYVPVSRQDVQRLAQSDTMGLRVNRARFRFPTSLRRDFQSLNVATPDSLGPDTTSVKRLFTAYHDPETKPEAKGGIKAFADKMQVPDDLKKRGVSSKILVRYLVHRDGTTTPIEVVRGESPQFATRVFQALEEMTFRPGTYRNQPVPTLVTEPFSVNIDTKTRTVPNPQ